MMINQNKIKTFVLLVSILLFNCASKDDSSEKKKKNLLLASALAYQQANANKPVVDTTPTCSYTSTGGTLTNVFFSTATTTSQSIKFAAEDAGFGVSLQSHSMVRVTTKANGKLTFAGSTRSGFLSVAVYANVDSCAVNAKTNIQLTSVFTATTTSTGATLTFNQANTYLVLSSIAFNSDTPAMTIKYSD